MLNSDTLRALALSTFALFAGIIGAGAQVAQTGGGLGSPIACGTPSYATATNGATVTVPLGCGSMTVQLIGEGGPGGTAGTAFTGGAGGGGVYKIAAGISIQPGTVLTFSLGTGLGTKQSCVTWGDGSCGSATTCGQLTASGNGYVVADCGKAASGQTGGVAGSQTFSGASSGAVGAQSGRTGVTGVAAAHGGVVTVQDASAGACQNQTRHTVPINLTASGQLFAGTSAKKNFICSLNIITATAQNIALVEGTGTVCATNIYGLAGGTTAATGWNFAANGGLTQGNGHGFLMGGDNDTNGAAANVCLLLSGAGQVSGALTYAQQ